MMAGLGMDNWAHQRHFRHYPSLARDVPEENMPIEDVYEKKGLLQRVVANCPIGEIYVSRDMAAYHLTLRQCGACEGQRWTWSLASGITWLRLGSEAILLRTLFLYGI